MNNMKKIICIGLFITAIVFVGCYEYINPLDPLGYYNKWQFEPMNGGVSLNTEPEFKIAEIKGASGYNFRISTTAEFIDGTVEYSSNYDPGTWIGDDVTFEIGDTIYWQVRPTYWFIPAEWSPVISFTIKDHLEIGDKYAGGYVFYLKSGVSEGLIAAVEDCSYGENAPWGGAGVDINGNDADNHPELYSELDDGKPNTDTIIAAIDDDPDYTYAAKLCNDLVSNRYNDWYLPAYDQLLEMRDAIGDNGTFIGDFYWSSTEFDADNARAAVIPGTTTTSTGKDARLYVRAIRSFTY